MYQDFKTEIKLFLIVLLASIVISLGGILLLQTTQVTTPSPQSVLVAKSISITTPVDSEQWPVGSIQTVTWKSKGIEKVRISPAVGGKDLGTSEEIDASAGTFEFVVPDMSGFGSQPPYSVTILIFDAQDASVSDRTIFTAIGADPNLSEFEGWQIYRNDEFGFEVKYPPQSELIEKNITFSDPAENNIVYIDLPIQEGTNMRQKYFIISEVFGEYTPGCTDTYDLYERMTNVGGTELDGIVFTQYESGEGAAGSYHTADHYVAQVEGVCIAMSGIMRLGNPGAFDIPPVVVDEAKEKETFDQILSTFRFVE